MSALSTVIRPTQLAQLATIVVSGTDARSFLQGQLSADLDTLNPQVPLLASCNSSQGRVQSILWILERSDGMVLVLPSSMVETTTARLRKYVLRSRVKIEAAPERLHIAVLSRDALPPTVALTGAPGHQERDQASYLSLPGHQAILVITPQPLADADIATELRWRLDDIRAGLPQIHPQTHEAFVAQMLNLDLLGGISFEKGCYTGQEIIARTHYRGAIKRRMFRFAAACPPPSPGARIVSGAQHAGDVVDAAPTNEGCELLAVVSLAQVDQPLELSVDPAVRLVRLEMPYEVT